MGLETNQQNGYSVSPPAFGLAGSQPLQGNQQRVFLNTPNQDSFQTSQNKKKPWYEKFKNPTTLLTGLAGGLGIIGLGIFMKKAPKTAATLGKEELEAAGRASQDEVKQAGKTKYTKGGGGGGKRNHIHLNQNTTRRIGKFEFTTKPNGKISITEIDDKSRFDYKTLEFGVKSADPKDYHFTGKPKGKLTDESGIETISDVKADGKRYTTDYLGQNQEFYDEGYRWGVSLGRDPKSFAASSLVDTNGKLTLDNGRYLIAIKANGEVIIGRESRGVHKAVLDQYQPGQALSVDGIQVIDGENSIRKFAGKKASQEKVQVKEILDVPNHSVLTGRGQTLRQGENEREFAAHFAGEVRVHNGQLVWANNQSGQFFGPASKNRFNVHTAKDERKLVDDAERNEFALSRAKRHFERITGSQNIQAVKVNFRDLPFNHSRLTAFKSKPLNISIPKDQLSTFYSNLKEPGMQELLAGLEYFPWKMKSMLEALPQRTPEELDVILSFMEEQISKETLKDFQAARMAAAMISQPKSVALFMDMPLAGHMLEGSYSNVSRLTANTKAKMIGSYEYLTNKMGMIQSFDDFITQINSSPNLLELMGSFRNSGGFLDEMLTDIPKAEHYARAIAEAHQNPQTSKIIHNIAQHANSIQLQSRLETIETAKRLSTQQVQRLSQQVEQLKDLQDPAMSHQLAQKEKALQGILERRAVPDNEVQELRSMAGKMSNEISQAHQELQHLLGLDIDLTDFNHFAFDKFKLRWTNDHILVAYLLKQEKQDPKRVAHFTSLIGSQP